MKNSEKHQLIDSGNAPLHVKVEEESQFFKAEKLLIQTDSIIAEWNRDVAAFKRFQARNPNVARRLLAKVKRK
jgi:hypothetical protein